MGRSKTTWLKFPMKISDVFDNDPFKFFMLQKCHPCSSSKKEIEVHKITTLLTYMRARTPDLGFMHAKNKKITLFVGKKEIQLASQFNKSTEILVREGLLELDVDPNDPEGTKQIKKK